MSKEAMREALEALEWMRVAFKPNTQGRQVADSAIEALKTALGPEVLEFDILDKHDQVIYNTGNIKGNFTNEN
jgi:thiazole synthase ThiGH ThiG subunit